MANKPIQSIKYPGLSDTYTFVQLGTEAGQAADAKVVGDEIGSKVSKPTPSPNGTAGQLLRTNGDGTTQWVDQGLPTDEQTAEAIDEWLTNHPEATTTVQDGSLTYKKLVIGTLGFVTPEMFGAVGDGMADDTVAIQSALNTEYPVEFTENAVYLVSSLLNAYNKSIIGNGATIKLANDISYIINSTSLTNVSGIVFDCNSHGVMSCVRLNNNADISIKNITIKNVNDQRSDKESFFIIVTNAKNVDISEIHISNCKHLIDGIIASGGGNITGVYISEWSNLCSIRNCSFVGIYNVDENDVVTFEDGGGIYVTSSVSSATCAITGIYGNNYCKRLIKSQCYNITVTDVCAYSDASDMLCAIGIDNYNSGNDDTTAVISNCIIINENTERKERYCITTRGKTTISNCILKGQGYATILCGTNSQVVVSNCEMVGGVQFEGLIAKFINCIIGGSYLNYAFANTPNSELSFENCIYSYADGEISGFFLVFNANASFVKLVGCKFNNVRNFSLKNNVLIDNCIFSITNIETLAIENGANVTMRNCEINGATSIGRAINVKSGGSLVIDGLETTNCTYSVIGSGTLSVKRTNIGRILATSLTAFTNYPEYRDTAPNAANCKDGALYINSNDGKLYKLTSGAWTAV